MESGPGTGTGYLKSISRQLSRRVSFAILGYLVCAVLSLAGVWSSDLVFVQFSIENYLCILASTYSVSAPAAAQGNRSNSSARGLGMEMLNAGMSSPATASWSDLASPGVASASTSTPDAKE